MNASFPTLLHKRARIIGSLTRLDLILLGLNYLLLSFLNVPGIMALLSNIALLLAIKLIQRHIPRGFLKFIDTPREYLWAYSLERL